MQISISLHHRRRLAPWAMNASVLQISHKALESYCNRWDDL